MDFEKDFEEVRSKTSLGSIFFLHHKGAGTLPALVFLHGVGASHRVWKKLMEIVPASFDIYLLDILGHGDSDAPRIDYTVGNQAQALREFLTANGITACYLIGHSYGAWISAYYSSIYHEISGLILEDSAGIKEELSDIQNGGVRAYQESMMKQLLSMNDNKDYVMQSILDADSATEYQLSPEVLSRISARTLIIWGEEDNTVNIKYSDSLVKGIKGSTFKVISDSGHNPHYTHAKEFYSLVAEFVNAE